jgi:hypothetical protein
LKAIADAIAQSWRQSKVLFGTGHTCGVFGETGEVKNKKKRSNDKK